MILNTSSIQVSVNPYSQYLLNSRSTLQSGSFSVGAVAASNIGQGASPVSLSQTYAIYKVMGIQASLGYRYYLSHKWSVALDIGNLWTNAALINETLIKNKTELLKDSLYGIISTDKDWQYVKKSFVTGKLSMAYEFKKCTTGASLIKPVTNVYKGETIHAPFNIQLFFRYRVW